MVLIMLMLILSFIMFSFMGSNLYWSRESSSCYECGFDPKDMARLPFSMRYFTILVFFLLFDVEFLLLLQLPLDMMQFCYLSFTPYMMFFLVIYMSILMEWKCGFFKWV